ncbi:uncharacterized protein WM277_021047 isoform 9-T11 [Molossus nigricans]
MATYPPRRLLGARPLPSDPCRDPRRSGFPQGSGGRWERRLPTGQGWGPLNLRCTFTHFQGPAARHITSRETWACAFPEQRLYFQPPYSRVVVLADKQPFPLRIYKEETVKEVKEENERSQITRISRSTVSLVTHHIFGI